MTLLTQADLDQLGCTTHGCDCESRQLFFHSACHPRAGVEVEYDKDTGYLTIRCNQCEEELAQIVVAD